MKPLNCNGCRACCVGDAVFLHPENGDNPLFYETVRYMGRDMLAHKPSKECVYLTKTGCGIYPVRPTICRELDCRVLVKKLGYTKARKMVKRNLLPKGMLQAAMRRMK